MVLFLFLGPSSRLFLASSVPRRFFFLLGTSPHFERPFLFPKKLPKDRRQPVQKDLVARINLNVRWAIFRNSPA